MQFIKCKCGKEFAREDKYFDLTFDNVLFRWKKIYCDDCLNKKIEIALTHIPEILDALAYNKSLEPTGKGRANSDRPE